MIYYNCQYCKKTFEAKDFKDEHIAMGTNGIDIFCPLCDRQIGVICDWWDFCGWVKVINTAEQDEKAARMERAEREKEFEQDIWQGVK